MKDASRVDSSILSKSKYLIKKKKKEIIPYIILHIFIMFRIKLSLDSAMTQLVNVRTARKTFARPAIKNETAS